jgi:pSer/pThr/pTyr-binding forkhead associated (FHA) protein
MFALRFISGKYQGGEFPLYADREIFIGRSNELEMVLLEDMVSRRHAKISAIDSQVVIEDLGSTNGTFVNGEKVQKVPLKEGDRILIGTSIIKLVTVDKHQLSEERARESFRQTNQRTTTSGVSRPMSGAIDEIPLPDLLQLLSTSRKSGVLSVRGEIGHGRVYLRKGQIYYASIDDDYDIPPRKAMFRILTWTSGNFELEPPDERSVLEELQETTEGLLMEGMRQLDEIRRIEPSLPHSTQPLALAVPLKPALRALRPIELDTLQLVLNHGNLRAILDHSPTTDLDTSQALLALLQGEYVVAGS